MRLIETLRRDRETLRTLDRKARLQIRTDCDFILPGSFSYNIRIKINLNIALAFAVTMH